MVFSLEQVVMKRQQILPLKLIQIVGLQHQQSITFDIVHHHEVIAVLYPQVVVPWFRLPWSIRESELKKLVELLLLRPLDIFSLKRQMAQALKHSLDESLNLM